MEHYELVTLEKYWHLDPAVQGYMAGLQSTKPGSELKDETNPYPMGTSDFELWARGYVIAHDREDV
jgi:hypothetical protein